MQPTHLLVCTLQTVPDTALPPDTSAAGSPPKPIQQRLSRLGLLLAAIEPDGQYERYELRRLYTLSLEQQEEREILAEFWRLIDRHRPRVVTWNGRSVALPVLKQRSLIHGLAAVTWHRTDPRFGYDYRYNPGWHCDLGDLLADYGASPYLSLHEAATAIGLPGQPEGKGNDVDCEFTVLNLYLLYLRWAYFSTRIGAHDHNASIANLLEQLENVRETQPQLGDFVDAWQASRQPCPLYVPEPEPEPGPQPPESHLRSEDVLP
ncbi:MAG: hypothetical protein U1F76_00375 [Candidatus Competibacteraceae bacterium]